MPLITKTFDYTGQFLIADLPAGTTTLTMHLWGGGGGPGGADTQGGIADGAAGHYVTVTNLDISAYAGAKLIGVAVGGGAEAGGSGQETPGGKNGQSLTGYSGGQGGSSGRVGSSGSGGGGGGATTVTIFEHGESADTIKLAIAGGGGGGGGTGAASRGGIGINTNSATSNTPGTLGENGAGHSGDGGGGGAGGGGADGGKGGSGATGDAGGFGGNSGSNVVPSGGSEDNGSGLEPGGTGSGYYTTGTAKGGRNSAAGGAGKAVLIFNIPSESKVKVGGAWKSFADIKVKVSGIWKHINTGYYKVGGVWKTIFTTDVLFNGNSSQFGNSQGGSTSGSEGSGGIPTIANVPPQGGGGRDSGGFRAIPSKPAVRHNPHTVSGFSLATIGKCTSPGNDGCFLAGTPVTMADGSTKPIEEVDIEDNVAVGGFVFATGKFLINDLYDYKGIKVAGSHMVKEDSEWKRVSESKIGKPFDQGNNIVYVFGCENRRIQIKDTLFTDYFDGFAQEGLQQLGEKYFEQWVEHRDTINDQIVDFVNKE